MRVGVHFQILRDLCRQGFNQQSRIAIQINMSSRCAIDQNRRCDFGQAGGVECLRTAHIEQNGRLDPGIAGILFQRANVLRCFADIPVVQNGTDQIIGRFSTYCINARLIVTRPNR